MSFVFRPAVRENVSLLLSLAGGTGSGKTYTAMRLAKGMSGDKPFCVIDTEAGRGKHYADEFRFDHGDLAPPFNPARYLEAIKAADVAKYPVIVVDSASHEHAGDGGLLDMHEAELKRMGGGENVKMAAWIKPKGEHRDFVNGLLQIRAHLILCFRAEAKVEMKKIDGRMQIVPKVTRTGKDGWVPICEKNLPFEMTASFLLTDDAPGIPKPIKLQEQHRHLFPLDKPIDEASGKALAVWAAGGTASRPVEKINTPANEAPKVIVPAGDDYDKAVKARAELVMRAELAAKGGYSELRSFWTGLSSTEKDALAGDKDRLTADARESDRALA